MGYLSARGSIGGGADKIAMNRVQIEDWKRNHLKCQICNYLLEDAHECMNEECRTLVCRLCINGGRCRFCSSHMKVQRASTFLQASLNNLNVACLYSDKGCEEICLRSSLQFHERSCPYKPMECEYCNKAIG